jgi:hypothetical protein
MDAMTHHRQVEIVAEKRSMFRPCQGLVAPDPLLDAMLSLTHGDDTLSTIHVQHKRIKESVMLP